MSINKKILARLSSMAHIGIAILLADLMPSIFLRIPLLVLFGVLSGVQYVCITRAVFPKDSSTGNNQQVNTEPTESQAGHANTASILENKELTD